MYLNDAMLDSGALARRLLAPANNLVPVNLLTQQDASLEGTGTGNWIPGLGSPTIARSTTYSAAGSASIAMTVTAATYSEITTGNTVYACKPNTLYTFSWAARGSAARTMQAYVTTYDSTGAGAVDIGTVVATFNTSGFTTYTFTFTTGSAAAFLKPRLAINTASAQIGDVVYWDKIGLWEGAGGSWVNGGERLDPSTLGWYWDESVGRRLFVWDTINSRWQMTYGDTGWRNVTADRLSPWTGGTIYIRRFNYTVFVRVVGLTGVTAMSNPYVLPAGFVAEAYANSVLLRENAATGVLLTCATVGDTLLNYFSPHTPLATYSYAGAWQFFVGSGQSWPTSLPGTASGSIPSA